MDAIKKAKILISLYAAIILIVLSLQITGFESSVFPILLRIITPLFAIYYGYKAVKFFGLSSIQGKSVLFMSGALFISWVANIFWVAGTDNSFLIANFFYVLMRPFFAFGIFYSIILLDKDFFKGRKLSVFISFMALLAIIYFYAFFTLDDLSMNINDIMLHSFIFFDFFLLAFAFLTIYFIYISFKGVYSHIWVYMGFGTFCFWLSEITYLANPDNYSLYGFIELGWALGFLLFALSFAILRIHAFNIIENARNSLKNKIK